MSLTTKIAALSWLALAGASMPAAAEPDLVIVVRHAEKAPEPAGDPGLSPQGLQRAQALADELREARLSAIVTTPFRRTRETAEPTADRFGIEPNVIAATKADTATHVRDVVAAIRALQGVVLVVGHSNTVPGIVAALSGQPAAPLCETSFSNLYLVAPQGDVGARLHLHYGAPDVPPAAAGCE